MNKDIGEKEGNFVKDKKSLSLEAVILFDMIEKIRIKKMKGVRDK